MTKRFIAKVFRNGGSQAVRLPKECQMPGDEVAVVRENGRLIIESINKQEIQDVRQLLRALHRADMSKGVLIGIVVPNGSQRLIVLGD